MIQIGDFRERLVTALASVPIVYIPHYDTGYIDEVLNDIAKPENDELNILEIEPTDIFEFDNTFGLIESYSKSFLEEDKEVDLCKTLKNFVFHDQEIASGYSIFSGRYILVLKNVIARLKDSEILSLLNLFSLRYYQEKYDNTVTIIIVGMESIAELPPSLERIITVVEIPTPNENEIKQVIKEVISMGLADVSSVYKDTEGEDDIILELIRTLQGLQLYEIKQLLKSILFRTGYKISSETIMLALEQKKQLVKKTGVIEVIDSDITLDQVGGLEVLKKDIKEKAIIFKHLTLAQSKEAHVPLPKGILILGMPGCGKSMIAKSIANEFGVSLLRLDVNRLMGMYVGQSEGNLRRALQTAEAAHPCVLWIDEIEKAFAGSESANNDIVLRMMGHFLTWMQERKSAVYVVATANDAMRPELMRKGRFDEVYFVDFPNQKECYVIFEKKVDKFKDLKKIYDFSSIQDSTMSDISNRMSDEQFSGAEIEAVVHQVITNAFIDYVKRKETDKDNKPTIIEEKSFKDIIEKMKNIVQSKQTNNSDGRLTQIERIKELGKQFKSASRII